jgi:hypothetical protein
MTIVKRSKVRMFLFRRIKKLLQWVCPHTFVHGTHTGLACCSMCDKYPLIIKWSK